MSYKNRRGIHFLAAPMLAAGLAVALTAPAAWGQDEAKSKTDEKGQPGATAKPVAQQKPVRPVAPAVRQAVQVKPADDFVGPRLDQGPGKALGAGAAPPAPKDIPAPTVVLKPGEVPGVRFDTPIYDFGKIRAGPDVEHDFWFTNTGTGPLEILRVKPS